MGREADLQHAANAATMHTPKMSGCIVESIAVSLYWRDRGDRFGGGRWLVSLVCSPNVVLEGLVLDGVHDLGSPHAAGSAIYACAGTCRQSAC